MNAKKCLKMAIVSSSLRHILDRVPFGAALVVCAAGLYGVEMLFAPQRLAAPHNLREFLLFGYNTFTFLTASTLLDKSVRGAFRNVDRK